MNKLEEKLVELGYKSVIKDNWYKLTRNRFIKRIVICNGKIKNDECGVSWVKKSSQGHLYKFQQDIDNLQQAFNQLQNNLEELREYER